MDSNAKSGMWFSKTIASSNPCVVNEKCDLLTFSGPAGESNIDLTLSSIKMLKLIRTWEVSDTVCSSDHRAIFIKIGNEYKGKAEGLVKEKRFDIKKANWDVFGTYLINKTESPEFRRIVEAESMAESLSRVVLEAASCSIPFKSSHAKQTKSWWNPNLKELRMLMNKSRRRLSFLRRISADDEDIKQEKEMFISKRSVYFNSVKKAKREDWERFVTQKGNKDPWGVVYRLIREKLSIKEALCSIKHEGKESMKYIESLKFLADALLPSHSDNDNSDVQEEIITENNRYMNMEEKEEFSIMELEIVIGGLKKGKAPGEEGIMNEMLCRVFEYCPDVMLKTYNKCLEQGVFPKIWKRGEVKFLLKAKDKIKSEPKSYRPICLLPTLGKVLEKLLVLKIAKWKPLPFLYGEHQFGFVKGRSTVDATEKVIKYVDSSEKKYVAGVLFDIEGAFNSLWWPSLLAKLRLEKCPGYLYKILKNCLEERYITFKSFDEQIERKISKGCPQGSVLGPVLWDINYEPIINEVSKYPGCCCVVYADDLIVLDGGSSRKELEEKMQKIINAVEEVTTYLRLKISLKKTEAILLKGGLDSRRPPILKIYGKNITFKESCKYLGIYLEKDLRFTVHARYVRDRLLALCGQIKRVVAKRWGINRRTLELYYKAIFIPILTYGAPSWFSRVGSNVVARVLISAQRQYLLMKTKACRTVSNVALQVLSDELPADLQILLVGLTYLARKGRAVNWKNIRIPEIEKNLGQLTKLNTIKENLKSIKIGIDELWQERWDSELKGRCTYGFIKKVGKVKEKEWLVFEYQITCFLTRHGFFRKKLFELGLQDEP